MYTHFIAQLEELWSYKPSVAGSIPANVNNKYTEHLYDANSASLLDCLLDYIMILEYLSSIASFAADGQHRIDRFERYDDVGNLILVISTTEVPDSDRPYETAISHPKYNRGKWITVELYATEEEAIRTINSEFIQLIKKIEPFVYFEMKAQKYKLMKKVNIKKEYTPERAIADIGSLLKIVETCNRTWSI